MSNLSNMLHLVTTKFNGKLDKAGQPYVLHCLKVMHYTKSDDPEIQMIALGHDLIEDTDVDAGYLDLLGFSYRVWDGIRCLTKIKGESYEEYKTKVKKNPDAIIVKMADLRHNSDIRRLKGITEKDILRTVEYHKFYNELKELV